MSKVTVPALGFGISPRGPRILPRRPTMPMTSGVASATSKSICPPCTFLTSSSPPTTSAPASTASRSFSPVAKTAIRLVLPVPCGSVTVLLTTWSAWRGSMPRRMCASIDESNAVTAVCRWIELPLLDRARGLAVLLAVLWHLTLSVVLADAVGALPLSGSVDVQTHRSRRPLDDPRRVLKVVRVQVGLLDLGDLADLLLGQGTHLVAI